MISHRPLLSSYAFRTLIALMALMACSPKALALTYDEVYSLQINSYGPNSGITACYLDPDGLELYYTNTSSLFGQAVGDLTYDLLTGATAPAPSPLPPVMSSGTTSSDGRYAVTSLSGSVTVIDTLLGTSTVIGSGSAAIISGDGSTIAWIAPSLSSPFGDYSPGVEIFSQTSGEQAYLPNPIIDLEFRGVYPLIIDDLTISADGTTIAFVAPGPAPESIWDYDVVVFSQPPVVQLQNLTVPTDPGAITATVAASTFNDASTDPHGLPLTFSADPAGPYAIGTTSVTITVSDGVATSTGTATVTAAPNPPVVRLQDLSVPTDAGQLTATVPASSFDAGSTDPNGLTLSFSANPASPYPIGTTAVVITVTDGVATSTGTATVTVARQQLNAVLSWSPAAMTTLDQLGPAQDDATASVPGQFIYWGAAALPTSPFGPFSPGTYAIYAQFFPDDSLDYVSGEWVEALVQVVSAVPAITWAPQPGTIVYGTPLTALQLDASATIGGATLPGSYSYTPPLGTILPAGPHQAMTVNFTPVDTADYLAASATATLVVAPAPLTITATSFTIPVGAPLPTLAATYAGFVNGDSSSSLSPGATLASTAVNSDTVATYPITVSGAADPNYTVDFVAGTLSVISPTNDDFANAAMLSGLTAAVVTYNRGATLEADEPLIDGLPGGHSLWWTWQAPTNGMVTITTKGSSFTTLLAVYTGTALNALTPVAGTATGYGTSDCRIAFPAIQGTAYMIVIDGSTPTAWGRVDLNLTQLPYPSNDDFTDAQVLTGSSGTVTGSNVGATTEPGEPAIAGDVPAASIWYAFTAPAGGGLLEVDTFGSSFNTLLGLYTGTSASSLTAVAANNNAGGTKQSRITAWIPMGTYYIAVDGVNGRTGSVNLDWTFTPAPANDRIANAATFFSPSDWTGTIAATNVAASKEAGEPGIAGNAGGASVWWTFTATQNGNLTLSTAGSGIATLLAAYSCSSDPASVTALTMVKAGSDNAHSPDSHVDIHVVAGTTYYVAVDGLDGAEGPLVLSWNFLPNDAFADALPLTATPGTALSGTISASNVDATMEAGEPTLGGTAGASVWWTYTVPPGATGFLELDTIGSDFDTVLAVFIQKPGRSGPSTLTAVAVDSVISPTDPQSQVTLPVTAGTTYYISVYGFIDEATGLPATGQVQLNWLFTPAGSG
jgi:hypothetical protein